MGKKQKILINPNITKFACMIAIITGWYMWPREAHYKAYDREMKRRQEADNG